MALEAQIQKDIMTAMKEKDTVRLNAVRSIKSAILLAKTSEGGSKELTDNDIVKLIQKLTKQRKEAALQYMDAGRKELAENELAEANILDTYLPKQLDEKEAESKIREIINRLGANKPSDMGKVMGVATKELSGMVDGKVMSSIVKNILSQQ